MDEFTPILFNTTDNIELIKILRTWIYHYQQNDHKWCIQHKRWKSQYFSIMSASPKVLFKVVSRFLQLGYFSELKELWKRFLKFGAEFENIYALVYPYVSNSDYIFELGDEHIYEFLKYFSSEKHVFERIERHVPKILEAFKPHHWPVLFHILHLYPHLSELNLERIINKIISIDIIKSCYVGVLDKLSIYQVAKFFHLFSKRGNAETLILDYYEHSYDTNRGDYFRRILHKYDLEHFIDGMFLEEERRGYFFRVVCVLESRKTPLTQEMEMLRKVGNIMMNNQPKYPSVNKTKTPLSSEKRKILSIYDRYKVVHKKLWLRMSLQEEYQLLLDMENDKKQTGRVYSKDIIKHYTDLMSQR